MGHPANRFAERVTVARQHLFERNGRAAEAPRFGGRAPLPPFLHSVLKEEMMHDRAEVSREGTASLEFTHNGIVMLDQAQLYIRRKIVSITGDTISSADEDGNPVDRAHIREE